VGAGRFNITVVDHGFGGRSRHFQDQKGEKAAFFGAFHGELSLFAVPICHLQL
jgi:hypothetical protein